MSPWLTAAVAAPQAAPFLYLVAAFCLCALTGLRAYLPLAALGLASTVPGPGGAPLLSLREGFTALGSPVVIALLVVLAIAEFGMDKTVPLGRVSDALQVLGRPVAGAVILAGASNPLSQAAPLLAAALGALIALAVHTLKATLRQAVTALSAGADNAIASTVEDVIAVALVLAVLLSPVVALALFAVAGIVAYRTLPRLWRRYRQLVQARQSGGVVTGQWAAPVLGHVSYNPPSTPALSRPLVAVSPDAAAPALAQPLAQPLAQSGAPPAIPPPGAPSYPPPLTSWAHLAPIPPLDEVRRVAPAPRLGATSSRPVRSHDGERRDEVISKHPVRPGSIPPRPKPRPGPGVDVPVAPKGTRNGHPAPEWYDSSRAVQGYAEESDGYPTYPPSSGLYPTDAPTVRTPTAP